MNEKDVRENFLRVVRWHGCLAIAISMLCTSIVRLADAPRWAVFLTAFVSGFAAMMWLANRAWRRYVRRKWSSIEA